MADAAAITEQMVLISAGRSTRFKLPTWDNDGAPLGVDVRRVVETRDDAKDWRRARPAHDKPVTLLANRVPADNGMTTPAE
jgi:hypothetical protein